MVYAILLDIYQDMVADEDFAVTYSSESLEDCQAQTHHDDSYRAWPKSDFRIVESYPCSLEGSNGSEDSGRILGLESVYGFVASAVRKFTIPVVAGVAAGLALARMAWKRGDGK
jgi:hypothetical protein